MMDCGMRPEEAMRMRKEHVFWDRSVVLVSYGKSFKSKRYVPLSDRIRKLLRLRESGALYLGIRKARPSTEELYSFVDEFVDTVQEVFPRCCIHFEDWSGVDAVHLLQRYRDKYCVYNDDVQGTAGIVLAGMISAAKIKKTKLSDEKYLFRCGVSRYWTRRSPMLGNGRGRTAPRTGSVEGIYVRYQRPAADHSHGSR
jgi:hypothetical protein